MSRDDDLFDSDYFPDDGTVELELCFHTETDKAILVSEEGNSLKAVWIPKSQIDAIGDDKTPGAVIPIIMSEWIANKKGLI